MAFVGTSTTTARTPTDRLVGCCCRHGGILDALASLDIMDVTEADVDGDDDSITLFSMALVEQRPALTQAEVVPVVRAIVVARERASRDIVREMLLRPKAAPPQPPTAPLQPVHTTSLATRIPKAGTPSSSAPWNTRVSTRQPAVDHDLCRADVARWLTKW